MARRRAPQNKAHTAAPENKEPFTEDGNDMLTAFAEKDAQLRRLLKAENNEFNGVLGRRELRLVADSIRAELRGDKEVDMGDSDD